MQAQAMIELEAGDYALTLRPQIGGSLAAFTWRGQALMRPALGDSILDAACFALVPFSNRIRNGRFVWNGREHAIAPNFPGSDHPHPLHGYGWLAQWDVLDESRTHAVLEHRHSGGEWPWPYRAVQDIRLSPYGLELGLTLTSLGEEAMPGGIGFHPFFPRTPATRYRGMHRGEWRNDNDCLPLSLDQREGPVDWWAGAPVGFRQVDTVYTGREGPLEIDWPERAIGLAIECSPSLPFTVVYTPAETDWFCVEPVGHITDAVNLDLDNTGLVRLAQGESLCGTMILSVVPGGTKHD